ncbi:hypothetical protein BH24ACI4_BH24ACI4_04750 [soil metagenome]
MIHVASWHQIADEAALSTALSVLAPRQLVVLRLNSRAGYSPGLYSRETPTRRMVLTLGSGPADNEVLSPRDAGAGLSRAEHRWTGVHATR